MTKPVGFSSKCSAKHCRVYVNLIHRHAQVSGNRSTGRLRILDRRPYLDRILRKICDRNGGSIGACPEIRLIKSFSCLPPFGEYSVNIAGIVYFLARILCCGGQLTGEASINELGESVHSTCASAISIAVKLSQRQQQSLVGCTYTARFRFKHLKANIVPTFCFWFPDSFDAPSPRAFLLRAILGSFTSAP